jgi:AcrR family transcriptional regulator
VTTDYSGGGDPARSLPLLWRDQRRPTRGPRPGLTVDRIVAAAIELADAEGLGALSMRRVADRLGVGTMSLYTYVPGKAELLDVMLDTVLAEVARPDGAGGWRAGLERRAREDWALFHRHPWMLQISPARALLGPNETELFEASLSAVAGTGLSGSEMVLAVSLVGEYTRGAAQSAVGAAMAEQRTGISDEQWWAAREPLFDKYFDPSRYPTVTRVATEGAFEQPAGDTTYTVAQAQQSFEFGLARVLDGIEAFINARSRPSADDQ